MSVVHRRARIQAKGAAGRGFEPLLVVPGGGAATIVERGRVAEVTGRDALAELLPAVHGWLPTLRIADLEVKAWIYDRGARARIADLLAKRL